MKNRWEYVFDFDLSMKMSIVAIQSNGSQALCPLCNKGLLRFYFHVWPTEEDIKIPPRGAKWVWCPECGKWTSQGNLGLTKSAVPDPFIKLSGEEFSALERGGAWIDQLNELWEKGDLHTVR